VNNSGSLTIAAPSITGKDKRKAKSDATEWFNFRNNPALMLTPNRLIPAKSAKLWPKPIIKALFEFILASIS
jgi:hypothetical protein